VVWGLLMSGVMAPVSAHAQEAPADVTSVSAAATYVVDPSGGRIDASLRLTVSNLDGPGGRSVDAVSILLPAAAGGVVTAARSGLPMEVVAGPIAGDFQLFALGLGRPLGPGGSAELDVRFAMVQGSPNREVSATRINEAYVTFPARGLGDPAQGSVRVVLPNWFEARWVGAGAVDVEPVSSVEGLARVFETVGVGGDFVAIVEARHDDSLHRRSVVLEDDHPGFEVASWPGDSDWSDSVEAEVVRLIPRLSELIGEPWPLTETMVIRETNAGLVHGYGGAFARTATGGGEIELGPTYSDRVLAHELAHAWFDDRIDPWLAEGLAEEFARQATEVTELVPLVGTDDARAIPLDSWVPLSGELDVDRFAYAAAGQLMYVIAADLGPEGLRDVIAQLLGSTSPYAPGLSASSDLADWQRFLDSAEHAGASAVEAPLIDWVLSDPATDLLDRRRAARDALDDFTARADDWGVPLAVSLAMANWDFDRADEALAAAGGLLDERDRLDRLAAALGVGSPTDARDTFAADPVESATLLLAQADGLSAVETAQVAADDERSWLESVGLWGHDVDARVVSVVAAYEEGDHASAVARLGGLTSLLDDAERTGQRRLAGGVSIAALLGLAVAAVRLRRTAIGRTRGAPDGR